LSLRTLSFASSVLPYASEGSDEKGAVNRVRRREGEETSAHNSDEAK
jgi:hypothetical protein